jgi:F-type H+-transporting ATPase subunit a
MKPSRKDRIVDILLIAMMILPFVGCMVLNILTKPPSDGINVTGAQIYLTVDMPLQPLYITEATVVSCAVVIALIGLCLFLTRHLSVRPTTKRQLLAETLVEKAEGLVSGNMGQRFMGFAPFIAAIMGLSALSSLSALLGLYAPTSDMNIVAGWAILVFGIITYYKLKCGVGEYLKGYTKPVVVLTPINIISEFATPISMAFRHYGNVLSGIVVSVLVGSALQGVSAMLLSWAPDFLASIPVFQVGIPAVLSVYFDVFSGLLQAFIFAMLTMLYVSGAFDIDLYRAKLEKKRARKNKNSNNVK